MAYTQIKKIRKDTASTPTVTDLVQNKMNSIIEKSLSFCRFELKLQ